jgi:hypothetical protein
MYNRTQNDNGTYNTRCLYCFMTIASALESPQEVNQAEANHMCPERALAELLDRRIHIPEPVEMPKRVA